MATFTGFDPRTGRPSGREIEESTQAEVQEKVAAAVAAFNRTRGAPVGAAAPLLDALADELDAVVDAAVTVAERETALGPQRLRTEMARTTGQLRMFADLVEESWYVEARIDHARPDLVPPRPDLRRMLFPIGPVAVFAASNFPFAFSVPGGDTASALAAGCPVVVKAHPSHPETSKLYADALERVLCRAGAPPGMFSMVQGVAKEVGEALVTAEGIKAVGFTGSLRGGRALFDLAARRPEPIPVLRGHQQDRDHLVDPGQAAGVDLAEANRAGLEQLLEDVARSSAVTRVMYGLDLAWLTCGGEAAARRGRRRRGTRSPRRWPGSRP